jgi:NitT/TauT family transport system substrate-binding protein
MRLGRALVVALTVLAVLAGTALGAANGRIEPRLVVSAPEFQYSQQGVSGMVAARALNALAAQQRAQGIAAGTTSVHFILNWLPNVEFAGLWMAQKFGWWKQAGINMTYKGWAPGVTPETDVPAYNGIAFGFQSGAAIAIARSRGVPITALYADAQKSPFGLTVLTKSGITSLKQLRGKKVGYQSHELYVPATMLSCVGLRQTDWVPRQVGFDTSQLTSGAVDAYLTFITNEPIALKLQGVQTRTFVASKYCFHFYDDVLFATNSLISKNPSLVKSVVGIVARGYRWAHTHTNMAARYTVSHTFPASKGTSAALNLKQQILELQAFGPLSADPSGQFSGLMNTATWVDSINTLYKYKEINSKPSAAAIYTNRFNPYK